MKPNKFSLRYRFFAVASLALLSACSQQQQSEQAPAPAEKPADMSAATVDGARIIDANAEPGNWLSYGRTYDEQRYSPLDQINDQNAKDLGLTWFLDLDTHRGQESTPLVVDGVMYVTEAWSKVKALDAKTGKVLWQFDPKVPGDWAVHTCCDVVNRGVALWKGKVYVGTIDGRLIALDAKTGKEIWSVDTKDGDHPYSITGAPRVIKGRVIIGNGGAEFEVRGYVTAYDAETGKQDWRFYTVPGDPSKGFENKAMEEAAKTWKGEWWKIGGGGTVWDAMAYDPDLDLLYIGTGNGSPWNADVRSPGGGDNLYLSSIVALRPETGEYVWHFQETPRPAWDYTATQHLILADLTIDGKPRKVIMQAPKNGYFYVIDRETGQFISANNYVPVNWSKGIDPKTGRPDIDPNAYYGKTGKPWIGTPGPVGGHNWEPMSYNPKTGLVYIPAQITAFGYFPENNFKRSQYAFNVGVDFGAGWIGNDPKVQKQILSSVGGYLLAWDPVKQKEAWRVDYGIPSNGGTLTTAGNLVGEGTYRGQFVLYRADNGEKLWSFDTQTPVTAPPMTYTVDGEQYMAIEVGWGGAFALPPGIVSLKFGKPQNISRLLAFKIGGTATLPPAPPPAKEVLNPPPLKASAETVAKGKAIYSRYCGTCHGDSAVGGLLPDLRYSALIGGAEAFDSVVLGGQLEDFGMVSFKNELSKEDADAIRAFIISQANIAKEQQAKK